MTRPRLLDLFCGAGGAAMGYHRAGFDVVGVDIKDQPRYPFDFIQDDALERLDLLLSTLRIDAIHASPPCKAFTRTGWSYRFGYHERHENLLTPTREALKATGLPWVIENVPGAPMRPDLVLCGCMFGLPELERERWFEFSRPVFDLRQSCAHRERTISPRGHTHYKGEAGDWARAMLIDWMNADELSQAIPPAYTEHVGRVLLEHLEVAA
jgi:DNA (cytosine-5)-methyltransferase 1